MGIGVGLFLLAVGAITVLPVGFKPLVDLMQQCREAGVPIYV